MTLSEAGTLLSARRHGADVQFTGVCHDTRTLAPQSLYVAIAGEQFDGHQFVGDAQARGAAAAMVERAEGSPLPALIVADTRTALGQLGAAWRSRFQLPVIAITGSNGKTTVKELTAAMLSERGDVLATRGNFNNDIGMPLTLLALGPEHHAAVIEMGANHLGEIDYLVRLAQPDVAVITCCAPAHLEGFGTVDDVARAKGEIVNGLAPAGTAVLNADDAYFEYWRGLAGGRTVISFGLDSRCDVWARWRHDDARGPELGCLLELELAGQRADARFALLGEHNVHNALAAAAAALAVGATPAQIARGLERARAVPRRLELKRAASGARLIDDTYNANPASFAAAIAVLRQFSGQTWLVMGDMAELGEGAERFHVEVGRLAKSKGVHRLFAVGPLSAHAVEAFGEGATHFASRPALAEALLGEARSDATLLVKGSRSMQMIEVVTAIAAAGDTAVADREAKAT